MNSMNHPDSEKKCEWWNGDKKTGFSTCQNRADWQHSKITTKGIRVWSLCERHKSHLLLSYNEVWRSKEQPEWEKINHPQPSGAI